MRVTAGLVALTVIVQGLALDSVVFGEVGFRGLGHLESPPRDGLARAVSADGRVGVGEENVGPGGDATEAFYWTASGGMLSLGRPAEGNSVARGVSADGSIVVGEIELELTSRVEAARWALSGEPLHLGQLPGHEHSSAAAVNADGSVVVGMSWISTGESVSREAFRWTADGGMVGLGLLGGGATTDTTRATGVSADGSVVVGQAASLGGIGEAFRWTAASGMQGLGQLSGAGFGTGATAVSADGSVVVGTAAYRTSEFHQQAFRWSAADGMVGLGFVPARLDSRALAVSADGSIVVGSSGEDERNALLWTESLGMVDLQAYLSGLGIGGLDGWILREATGISADGRTIVGYGTNPQLIDEAWIVTIPEPATPAATFLLALIAIAVPRRLRRR